MKKYTHTDDFSLRTTPAWATLALPPKIPHSAIFPIVSVLQSVRFLAPLYFSQNLASPPHIFAARLAYRLAASVLCSTMRSITLYFPQALQVIPQHLRLRAKLPKIISTSIVEHQKFNFRKLCNLLNMSILHRICFCKTTKISIFVLYHAVRLHPQLLAIRSAPRRCKSRRDGT